MQSPIVEMKGISKSFPGVKALQGVDFTLYPATVHGLVGENGAGKSTLMKVLTGTWASYEGEVIYQGKKVHFNNEHDALSAGIAIVPQELNFVPDLTVEENIFLVSLHLTPPAVKRILAYDYDESGCRHG